MSTPPSTPGRPYAGDLTPQEAWDLLAGDAGAVLVDVRTTAEWRFVGVPDVSALDRDTVLVEWVSFPAGSRNPAFVDELARAGLQPGDGRPVVFLCRSGRRSIGAATVATAAGFGPAYNVLEGFEGDLDADGHRGGHGWRAAGLPWRQS